MHRTQLTLAAAFAMTTAASLTGVGCRNNTTETASAMQGSLAAEIPFGTPVSVAESRLTARGFTVTAEMDAPWGTQTHFQYLYGDMRQNGLVQRRWQVAVFQQAGMITGIDVTSGLVGP